MIPELLAPAGNLDTAIAAFEHGADAVYCGLKKFNARERTRNFSVEELTRLIRYGRGHGKKVYLTFNTLIKDVEIGEAYTILDKVADIEPDAVLIQDLGVFALMRRYFPHLTLHASTQMGIHNSAGVALLEEWGFDRVILERQITLDEIEKIKDKSSIGLEVFIHGALCCSFSGMCLFSSWMGGWSGNRGKCKQPCRRRYISDEGNGFFFSTNDLYSLEDIPRLKRTGVRSLKIEGRLKGAGYVVPVVEAYRKVLDAPNDLGKSERDSLLSEARGVLGRSGGRYWSRGFRDEEEFDTVINHTRLGVSGALVGKVGEVRNGGFTIVPKVPVRLKDELRVQPPSGDEGPSFEVTKLSSVSSGGKPTNYIPAGTEGFIFCDKEIPRNGLVYKIGHETPDYTERIKRIGPFELSVRLEIIIEKEAITVTVIGRRGSAVWEKQVSFPEAKTRPLEKTAVEEEFRKDNSWFSVKSVMVKIKNATGEGALFCTPKNLRNLRQEFFTWLESRREVFGPEKGGADADLDAVPPDIEAVLAHILKDDRTSGPEVTVLTHRDERSDIAKIEKSTGGTVRKALFIDEFGHSADDGDFYIGDFGNEDFEKYPDNYEAVLPSFCSEGHLAELGESIDALYKAGLRRFRVTSIYGFTLLRKYRNVTITCGSPLPAANRFAFYLLFRAGARKVQSWVELEETAIVPLIERFGGACEVFVYGRVPLLKTRAVIPAEGFVKDGRGGGFFIEREVNRIQNDITAVYPEAVFSIVGREGRGKLDGGSSEREKSDDVTSLKQPPKLYSRFYDLSRASVGEQNISEFNFRRELV